MATEFEFIWPTDRPALTLLTTPEWLELSKAVLTELGYKVHCPETHEEFISQFGQVNYQVVIAETLFAANAPSQNLSLLTLQRMSMNTRRHAVVLLIGEPFQTLNAMHAFQQSVHAVIHPRDLPSLSQIVQQVFEENNQRLAVFRDTELSIAKGKL